MHINVTIEHDPGDVTIDVEHPDPSAARHLAMTLGRFAATELAASNSLSELAGQCIQDES